MNYCKAISALLTLSFTCVSAATNYEFVGTDNSIETQLCINAGSDNKAALKTTLRKMGIKERRKSINHVLCNNVSPAKFAFKYGATSTFEYLNKRSYGEAKVRPSVTISDVAKLNTDRKIVIEVSSLN